MSEIPSAEKIAELVEAAKQGRLPEQGSGGGHRRGHRMRTVDFSRPTKFTSDHQRRIARAVETFCQTAVTRLSAELRSPVELETIGTMQLTWSAAQSQLPPGSISVTLEGQPIGTRMLLTVEQSFVLMCLECLLGGSPDRPPRGRRLSEIDWSLTRHLVDSIVHQLSLVWQDLTGIGLSASELDLHNEASQVAPVSEPTFAALIESRINKHSSALALLIPWIAIEPVAERISGHGLSRAEGGADQGPGVEQALSSVPVTIRAEVAAVQMAVAGILALAPGSVVRLGARADQGVALFAENVELARAQPGSNGSRRAVQIRGMDWRSS